jgi:tetratricopeptide (TPR) repeat protein
VQTLLTDLLWKTGDREGALAACRRALEVTAKAARQAHLYRVLGKLHEDHNPLSALGHYDQAAQLFAPDDAERPALLKDRAWLHMHRRPLPTRNVPCAA